MDPKQKAEDLFLNTDKSQKEIADQLGIDPKTLYRWIKQGHWRELKSTTRRMPSVLVENIYSQLDDINYSISQRERGSRHPGKDESLTINRLINCIEKVKKQTSQGQNIEFMMNFIDWVMPQNKDLADLLTNYGSAFLKGAEVHGFHPYDVEYQNPSDSRHCLPVPQAGEESTDPCAATAKQSHDNTNLLASNNSPWPPDPNNHSFASLRGTKQSHDSTNSLALDIAPWPADPNLNNRHPEFISGPHDNTANLAQKNSPLERGQGCVQLSSKPWPTDPNNRPQIGPAPQTPSGEVGHESGIPKTEQSTQQPTENHTETTGNPETPMPESVATTAFPDDLWGKQSHANMNFSNEGQAKEGNPLPPATDFPPASEIDFTNPNALYDLVMKQQKESEEDFQLFSIGEAIYKVPVDRKKKKR